jgi:Rrf2 family protein
MFRLNKSSRFALYAVVELARDPQAVLSAGNIAEKYGISEHHVAKVMQQLSRTGIVRSLRGIGGGFQLAKDPRSMTMLDVVQQFERPLPEARRGCLLLDEGEDCNLTDTCRIGEVFAEIQDQAFYTLKSISIATLIQPKKIA